MDISDSEFLIAVGIRIRQLREKKNLSQQDLADDCGMPKVQIGRIERAEVNTTIKTLVKISIALETTPSEILNIKL